MSLGYYFAFLCGLVYSAVAVSYAALVHASFFWVCRRILGRSAIGGSRVFGFTAGVIYAASVLMPEPTLQVLGFRNALSVGRAMGEAALLGFPLLLIAIRLLTSWVKSSAGEI